MGKAGSNRGARCGFARRTCLAALRSGFARRTCLAALRKTPAAKEHLR